MTPSSAMRRTGACLLFAAVSLAASRGAYSQTPPPAWDFTGQFRYKIENVLVNNLMPGTWNVKVIFSVINPVSGQRWDIANDLPFKGSAAVTLDVGWDSRTDFVNTGSANTTLAPVISTRLGTGAAIPIQVRDLHKGAAQACSNTTIECPGIVDTYRRFWVETRVSPIAFVQGITTGRVALEGRAVCNDGMVGCPAPGLSSTGALTYANIPLRSEVADFSFTMSSTPIPAMINTQRRQIVDFASKCNTCHDGKTSNDGVLIPRLSLHGNNRNENLELCVICHNPNQTDVPYRVSGPETSVDLKRMIHSIHAGGFRETPFVVIGFNGSVNDFSHVRFPKELRNCVNCHIDSNGKGTFELPLNSSVLGTTVSTGSVYAVASGSARTIDVNPSNDLKISPIAAVCSSCHDKTEVRSHMISKGGASFATLQQNIGVSVNERCATCHGPGKDKDVRKVHQIQSGGTEQRRERRRD